MTPEEIEAIRERNKKLRGHFAECEDLQAFRGHCMVAAAQWGYWWADIDALLAEVGALRLTVRRGETERWRAIYRGYLNEQT